MYVNLHTIPAGQAMYTLAVTSDPPPVTEHDNDVFSVDEVDFVASTRLTSREVARRAQQAGALEGYEGMRVVGVVNQSDGHLMWQDLAGDALA